MKKLIQLAFSILAIGIATQGMSQSLSQTPTASGKGRKTPEQRAQAITDRMKKNCGLSDDQSAKAYKINLNIAKRNEALKSQRGPEKRGLGKQFFANEQERINQFNTVLSPEQVACYKKMREEAKNKRMNASKKGSKEKKEEDIDDEVDLVEIEK